MNDNRPEYTAPLRLERGLSRKETASILGYDYSTVCRMVKAGELESYGTGKKLRIYESSIQRYRLATQNNNPAMQEIKRRIRRTGARHRAAMEDLQRLLYNG